jgi:hypothetical protein
LMKKCLDLNQTNRPNVTVLCQLLSSITKEAENYRILHLTSLMENRQTATHPQAIYSPQLLNPYIENLPQDIDDNSECLDCAIQNK